MGRSIGFHILKNPKFKPQFDVLYDYIMNEYSGYLETLPKKYYNEEENHYASEDFGLSFNDYDGEGHVSSNAKVLSEYPEFVDYIIKFWEGICRKYFYEEVALFDITEFWDEGSIYYFYHGESKFLYGTDLGFIEGYCSLAIMRYNEPFLLDIKGVDKEKALSKIEIIERRLENEGNFSNDNKIIETLRKDMILKAKKCLDTSKTVKSIIISGEGGVGKTTFLFRNLLNKFYPDTPCFCADFFLKNMTINNEEITLFIWDVMGQNRARFLEDFFATGVDGAILCFDLTRGNTLQNIEDRAKLLQKSDKEMPIIILGFKSDRLESSSAFDDYALDFKEKFNLIDYLRVSNATGENVEESFKILIKKIHERPTVKKVNVELLEKKLKLLEYLKTYKIQGKEELQLYFKDYYDDSILEERCSVPLLLLYSEFRDKIQHYIEEL